MKDVGSSILGGATSGIGNALGRQAADTVIETAVDTVVDVAQGGNISPASIGTSLAINAIIEGVSSKTVKGQKGDVSSHKDALPVQQVSRPDKSTPKTDFYAAPDGTIFKLSDIKNKIDPFNLNMTQTVKNHAYDIATKGKYKGEYNRPYINSEGIGLLLQEIIESGVPTKDKYLPNSWRWDVSGSFNGRSTGNFELVIDLDQNMITHFNFTR